MSEEENQLAIKVQEKEDKEKEVREKKAKHERLQKMALEANKPVQPQKKTREQQEEEWKKDEIDKPMPALINKLKEPEEEEEDEEEEEEVEKIEERPQIVGKHIIRDLSQQIVLPGNYEAPLSIWNIQGFESRIANGFIDPKNPIKTRPGLEYEFKVLRAITETFWHKVGTVGEQSQFKKYIRNINSLPCIDMQKEYRISNTIKIICSTTYSSLMHPIHVQEYQYYQIFKNVFNYTKAFIMAQAPRKETVQEFMKFVLVNEVKLIIMLGDLKGFTEFSGLPKQEKNDKIGEIGEKINIEYQECYQYWPNKNSQKNEISIKEEEFDVTTNKEKQDEYCKDLVRRSISISWKTIIKRKMQERQLELEQIQWQSWNKYKKPEEEKQFKTMEIITSQVWDEWTQWKEEYDKQQQEEKQKQEEIKQEDKQQEDKKQKKQILMKPILIHSSDCMGRSGVMLACIHIKMIMEFYLLEVTRMRKEKMKLAQSNYYEWIQYRLVKKDIGNFEISVFSIVRRIREERAYFVETFEQYQYVYEYCLYEIQKFNTKIENKFKQKK